MFSPGDCRLFARALPKIPCFCPGLAIGRVSFVNQGLATGEIAMNIRASGRSALIIAAGFLCLGGPLSVSGAIAAPADSTVAAPMKLTKFTRHHAHHGSRHASRRHKVTHTAARAKAKKPDADTSAGKAEADNASTAPVDNNQNAGLPPTVANANAEMPAENLAASAGQNLAASSSAQPDPGAPPAAAEQSPQATPAPQATADVVPSDEVNDIDRAMNDDKPAATVMAMTTADTPAAATQESSTTGQAAANDDSTWRQTSLIGKIFIAFGGLLTLASAARMFMA
ncbi:MAG TPA: hypothetical protein VHC94_04065 [Nitrobacter sp.]|jgi:hypothetical protein|nr:hypothetical protein [Nitrobacter sp.]